MSKQDIIHQNAKKINEDCVKFDLDLQDLENNKPVCMADGCSKYHTG